MFPDFFPSWTVSRWWTYISPFSRALRTEIRFWFSHATLFFPSDDCDLEFFFCVVFTWCPPFYAAACCFFFLCLVIPSFPKIWLLMSWRFSFWPSFSWIYFETAGASARRWLYPPPPLYFGGDMIPCSACFPSLLSPAPFFSLVNWSFVAFRFAAVSGLWVPS